MDKSNSSDKVLENLVENKEAEMRLRNSENEFAVPGTPIILPGRGVLRRPATNICSAKEPSVFGAWQVEQLFVFGLFGFRPLS